jgi:hypothetical protein
VVIGSSRRSAGNRRKPTRFVKVSGAEAKGQARSHDPVMVLSSVVAGE